jgi:DnaJ-class molecular chaperone
MKSLYEALGVSKGATTEEIRRAYKDLAKQKHPDRGGNPEEFKAIQEAHEVLCDEGRRKMYDMTGSTEEGGGHGPMGPMAGMAAGGIPFEFMGGMGPFGMPGVSFDFGSMFGGMFGGGGGGGGPGGPGSQRRRGGKSPNKHHDIGLNLGDFYNGREIKLKFNQGRRCKACGGSGADQMEPCTPCGGRGIRTQTRIIGPGMMAQSTGPCDVCSGEGKRVLRTCKICHGKKLVEAEKELLIVIKPGMIEGETLVFDGECSDTFEYEQPGDVVLTLKRADIDNTMWEWRFADLWTQATVSFAESVLGFQVELKGHPSGKSLVVGWHGGPLMNGKVMKVRGWGMPKKEGGGFGDAYVQLSVTPPSTEAWSAEQRAKLEEVLGAVGPTLVPKENEVELETF